MKNIYKSQKNELKNLIYIQENKPCNEQTINGLFRSIVEPVLESNSQGVVLLRLQEKRKEEFSSTLKRLEFCNAKVYDFSSEVVGAFENILKEDLWDKTEFVYVLAERFGAVLIFDFEESEIEDHAGFYILHNSKVLADAFNIIASNSTVDLSDYQIKFNPDRRDNDILNSSIRKIVGILDETNKEVLISNLEKENAVTGSLESQKIDLISKKTSYFAHEMRNLLSICNLYSTIIDRHSPKAHFDDKEAQASIINARNCIQKALKMLGNFLFDFKTFDKVDLQEHDLETTIKNSLDLAQIYAGSKNISFACDIQQTTGIMVDENKLISVLINLIKNAVESIDEEGKIEIKTKIDQENVKIIISNNGRAMLKETQDNAFKEGFTTKKTGSGIGLFICKKTLEDQYGQLRLIKSDEASTEFEITLMKA